MQATGLCSCSSTVVAPAVGACHVRRPPVSVAAVANCAAASRHHLAPRMHSEQLGMKEPRGVWCGVMAGGMYGEQDEDMSDEEQRQAEVLAATTRRIKELGAKGRMKDAIQALANLSLEGVEPDTVAATTLVRACTRDMQLAESVFEELFVDFLDPDEVTFAVLLRGYGGRSPPEWARIDATLTKMKKDYGIEPTSTSYNVLLEVCARTNDLDRGQDVIDRMVSDDVEPDEFSMEAVAKRRALRSYLKKNFSF